MSHSPPTLPSGEMAATSLHVGRLRVYISTPGASRIANRKLRIYRFRILVNSPARRNNSTNEFTSLDTLDCHYLPIQAIHNTGLHIYVRLRITIENI